jgi:hypothetical protein
MQESTVNFRQLATTSKEFARRLLTIGENRLELLTVEVQEERELKRAQMVGNLAALAAGARTLANRTKSIGLVASSAAVMMAGLAPFLCGKPADSSAKPSWVQSVLKGAGLFANVWLAFRSPDRSQKDKSTT